MAQSCLASGSIPVTFKPQLLNGYAFQDGGTFSSVNLVSAVEQCMEVVDDYADIIVDIAICGYSAPPATTVSKNAKDNWDAMKTTRDYYLSSMSVIGETRAYPGLDIRYYF